MISHDELCRVHDLAMDFVESLDTSESAELRWELFAIMCGISNLILPIEGDVRILDDSFNPEDFRAMADVIERHTWRATPAQAEALRTVAELNRDLAAGSPIFTVD